MLPNCDNSAASRPRNHSFSIGLTNAFPRLATAAVYLDVEIPDLLSERVAVEAKQVGRADLVAARGGQRRGEQRDLNFLENPVVEAWRRHAIRETGEVRGQIGLDRAAEIFDAHRRVAARGDRRRGQFA